MICPNADGTESPTYHEHADADGLDTRLRILASHADRATMLRVLEERDIGCVTLTMPKHALNARLTEARFMVNPQIAYYRQAYEGTLGRLAQCFCGQPHCAQCGEP